VRQGGVGASRGIEAVTVDFWGTLIFDGPHADERYRHRRLVAFEAILNAAGLPVAGPALARGYNASARDLGRLWSENRDLSVEGHVASILDGAQAGLRDRLAPDTMAALVEAYAGPALAVPPPPDARASEGLAAVSARGIRLAVVSNTMRTPGSALRGVLAGHGLLEPFTHLTFSDEVGVRKPAPENFHLTLRRLGVAPARAVHVGDDPVLDVEGARAAGMRVIQVLSRGDAAAPAADRVIRHLGELPRALAELEEGGGADR
jgi:putative hydrolase of the HAD superfamily